MQERVHFLVNIDIYSITSVIFQFLAIFLVYEYSLFSKDKDTLSTKANYSDKYGSIPSHSSSVPSINDEDDFDDFDPRGTSSTSKDSKMMYFEVLVYLCTL